MKRYKEDLRVVRTRKLLSTALFNLLEITPYEKISVMDICKKAMVHRATFYNHFEDKEHLLEYTLDEIKENLYEAVTTNETYTCAKDMYMALIAKVIDFVDDNRKQLLLIVTNNSLEKVSTSLIIATKKSLTYLIGNSKCSAEFTLPTNVIIDFLSGGIANLGLNWIKSENPCSKQDLLKYFSILLNEKVYLK